MSLSQRASHHRNNQSPALLQPGVSEIMIPAWEQASIELVLPMLAHLSHQTDGRWLTWVGKSGLSKSEVTQHHFKGSQLRMIHTQSDEETLWVMWEALNNGTSAFTAASFDDPSSVQSKQRAHLERACFNGNARGLVIKFPTAP